MTQQQGNKICLTSIKVQTVKCVIWSTRCGIKSVGESTLILHLKNFNKLKIESIIFQVLKESMENGFEQDRIDGIIYQMELGLKHV